MNLKQKRFNTQPPEGGWKKSPPNQQPLPKFQHTAARRRLETRQQRVRSLHIRFNTQPPEGGWQRDIFRLFCRQCFNTQPPEGGWPTDLHGRRICRVSTHSRPKAAGWFCRLALSVDVCFNTQPPEGGWLNVPSWFLRSRVFQHTAARRRLELFPAFRFADGEFQHTAARRRLDSFVFQSSVLWSFQHTAARRRLERPSR